MGMSENETVMENPYEEREQLFRSAEQMTMKIRIVDEEARKLFPELANDLEVNGLISDVLIDDDGFIHDGFKRVRLLGLEQIKGLGKLKLVPRESKCENIVSLTRKQKMEHLKWVYEYHVSNDTWKNRSSQLIDMLAKRYGISRRTLYRWIETNFTESTQVRKPKEQKFKGKCNVCDYPRQVQNLTEELTRVREQYQKAITNIEEVISSDEFRLSKAISLFLERHPDREFSSDGKILEKLT
jgi:hypothetical protein